MIKEGLTDLGWMEAFFQEEPQTLTLWIQEMKEKQASWTPLEKENFLQSLKIGYYEPLNAESIINSNPMPIPTKLLLIP